MIADRARVAALAAIRHAGGRAKIRDLTRSGVAASILLSLVDRALIDWPRRGAYVVINDAGVQHLKSNEHVLEHEFYVVDAWVRSKDDSDTDYRFLETFTIDESDLEVDNRQAAVEAARVMARKDQLTYLQTSSITRRGCRSYSEPQAS